mgnify:CR=1 FL=1
MSFHKDTCNTNRNSSTRLLRRSKVEEGPRHLVEERERAREHHSQLLAVDAERRELAAAARQRAEREDLLRFQLNEIDALKLSPDAVSEWEDEASRLRHADVLVRTASRAEEHLYADDGSLCEQLGSLLADLEDAAAKDSALQPVVDSVFAARSELEEAARTLGSYARSIEADPNLLSELEERLHEVRRLVRKHGHDLTDVLERAEAAREELDRLENLDADQSAIEQRFAAIMKRASAVARALSDSRRRAAHDLGTAITEELHSLGMGNARVEVDIAPLTGADGFKVDGARLSASGLDHVEFLIAPNPGEDPRPLREIASGGELSRALLGVKRVLAQRGPVGTYIFDEVDSGVGGAIAEVIGRKLADVGQHHQVLCITHLPQVAAHGDRHLLVRKQVIDERTHSSVVVLSEQERTEELARMLGGARVTSTTIEAAREMITSRVRLV